MPDTDSLSVVFLCYICPYFPKYGIKTENDFYSSMIQDIIKNRNLSLQDLSVLLSGDDAALSEELRAAAQMTAQSVYGKKIFMRGLVEVSNHCKNDCYYCGIRKSNAHVDRYRLDKETILQCCRSGYALGFRTFVLQGGEDGYYTDSVLCDIVSAIKQEHPDCAVTLSLGERSRESYRRLFEAGADRYLLRHETANEAHYRLLHPESMSLNHRKECLFNLKDIGYQVGCGFMVGSPGQTPGTIYEDLQFIRQLQPQMVGIGPFIPEHDTPFAAKPAGTLQQTLTLLSIIRLLKPNVLLPATTALGTISPTGREEGIRHGANVIMPNLSPLEVRGKYLLYDNKICTGDEAAECRACVQRRIESIGYELVVDRGDCHGK